MMMICNTTPATDPIVLVGDDGCLPSAKVDKKWQELQLEFTSPASRQPFAKTESPSEIPAVLAAQLARLALLPSGWDSYRAPSPSATSVALAREVVASLGEARDACRVELASSLDGGIALTLERGDCWVDITCANDGTMRLERSDDVESVVSVRDVAAHVNWLSQA